MSYPESPYTPPLTAPISVSVTGATTIVQAQPGQYIVVIRLFMIANGNINVTMKDSLGNVLTGAMPLTVGAPLIMPYDNMEYFRTARGAGLILDQGADAASIQGVVAYLLI